MPPASHAISIILVPTPIGSVIPGPGVIATAAPSGVIGGGALNSIFETAKAYWESAISDNFSVTVNYGWGNTGGINTLALEQTQTYSGAPQRITAAGIVVRSQGGANWFADPTPADNREFGALSTLYADSALCNGAANCEGILTTGIVYSGAADPAIISSTDLLTVVIHELGHALGLDVGYSAYTAESSDFKIDLTGPFAGTTIFDNGPANAHLDPAQGNLGGSLMQATLGTGLRRLPSGADILAVCQVSGFTDCSTTATAPEPAPTQLLLASALAFFCLRRRK
jgi:hypothetical protein